MGSKIEINDTLQLTTEQGFPRELVYSAHVEQSFQTKDFAGKKFSFSHKDGVRVFQLPPVRNFLVHNIDGKWLYWGLVHILEIKHDTTLGTTSGTFEIIHIYTPEEMRMAHTIVDRRDEFDFFRD
jgi:hypothetical protein